MTANLARKYKVTQIVKFERKDEIEWNKSRAKTIFWWEESCQLNVTVLKL